MDEAVRLRKELFDSLRLISPVVVTGKIMIQEIALLKIGLDALVLAPVEQKWKTSTAVCPS